MSLIKTSAIVLGSRPLGEADKLVTFFTLLHGKITGAARGARRMRSRFGSSLEQFTHCEVILFQKTRDALYRIRQTDILQSFQDLREDLDRIRWTSRVTALTSAMAPEGEPNAQLFNLLLETLTALKGKDGELATRLFEVCLLGCTGYQPRLEMEGCPRCRHRLDAADVYFSPTFGGILCRVCKNREGNDAMAVSRGTVAFLKQALKMPPKLAFRLKAPPTMRDELKNLLEVYLDYLLDRASPR